ncbi:hypothetical protein EDB86DRAFT_2830876 [Lactarius hatsudake]|nr:hypothetical protein EDB86DRAFT_2830876 [Lactarius hatsudake]
MVESSSPPQVCGIGGVVDAVVATVPDLVPSLILVGCRYTSTRDDSHVMLLPLPPGPPLSWPLSGNPLTMSVFNSPACPLLKTTLLGSPGCSLGLNYIINAELANCNTGSSDDSDYNKGQLPQQQNNSRWQGNNENDEDIHNNLKTTTMASRHNDDFKTTTTTSRQWQQQDKAMLARRSRQQQQQQQGDFSSNNSDDSDNDNVTRFKQLGFRKVGNRKVYSGNSAGKETQERKHNSPSARTVAQCIAGAGKLAMKEQEMVKEAVVQEVMHIEGDIATRRAALAVEQTNCGSGGLAAACGK